MVSVSVLPLLFSYGLGTQPIQYHLKIDFDGYLPVLGGMQQKARVDLALQVIPEQKQNALTAKTSLTSLALSLMDTTTGKYEPFNIGLDSVKQYFPESTISYLPNGHIVSTTAPKFNLPVRLPGLHTQHIPEISFMPLEFPAGGVEKGVPFEVKNRFGDSTVTTQAIYQGAGEGGELFEVKVRQEYETYEDEYHNTVPDRSTAKVKVATLVTAEGKLVFSAPVGWVLRSNLTANAKSTVYALNGKPTGATRQLLITFELGRKTQ